MGVQYLIRMPGIPGDVAKGTYAGWLEVKSVSIGGSQRPSIYGGSSSGRSSLKIEDIGVLVGPGPATPLLMKAIAEGKRFPKVSIVMLSTTEGEQEAIYEFELTNAMISSLTFNGNDTSFQLVFDKIESSYRGSAPKVGVTAKKP